MSSTITFATCKDFREARRIARALVGEKLAACVNLVRGVSSVYAWKGRIEDAREVLLIIKSRDSLSRRLLARVKELHSYSIPEVVTMPIASGNPDYLEWILESTR